MPIDLLRDDNIKYSDIVILVIINDMYSSDEGEIYQNILRKKYPVSKLQLIRSLNTLKDNGYIVHTNPITPTEKMVKLFEQNRRIYTHKNTEDKEKRYQNDTTDGIKMIPERYQNDTTTISDGIKMIPERYQNDTTVGIKMIPNVINTDFLINEENQETIHIANRSYIKELATNKDDKFITEKIPENGIKMIPKQEDDISTIKLKSRKNTPPNNNNILSLNKDNRDIENKRKKNNKKETENYLFENVSKEGMTNNEYQEIQDKWNGFANKHGLENVEVMTVHRKAKLKQRLGETLFDFDLILEIIPKLPFYLGDNQFRWKVTFDWILGVNKDKHTINYHQIVEKKNIVGVDADRVVNPNAPKNLQFKESKYKGISTNFNDVIDQLEKEHAND